MGSPKELGDFSRFLDVEPSTSGRQVSSEGSSTFKWVAVGVAATAAAAGLGYLAYRWVVMEEEDGDGKAEDSDNNNIKAVQANPKINPLHVAKIIQMRTVGPGPAAVRKTPAPATTAAAKPKAAPASKPASAGKRACAFCQAPCTGLPLRCSQCKAAYYCSQQCQRKAWAEHKEVCKPAAKTPAAIASTTSEAAASAEEKPTTDAVPTQQAEAAQDSAGPTNFQETLAKYLEDAAASKSDKLESMFETAVMLFVRSEYRAAVQQLERVQEIARERGNLSMQGEVFKWMGHSYNKLSEVQRAEGAFNDGIAFAREHGMSKLEIDCLGGLGCMFRALDQSPKAVTLLSQALELCERERDEDSRAATLCNLGAALMQSDSETALKHLREAVSLREKNVETLHAAGERNGLATAVMEHANALVNLASALFVTKQYAEAKSAYEAALEVFELVEDVDKVAKVLVNLANMTELQVGGPEAAAMAASYRDRLAQFLAEHGVPRRMEEGTCSVCLAPIDIKTPSAAGGELVVLACLHCFHNKCWEGWVETHQSGKTVTCPNCKQAVPLFGTEMN